MAPNCPDRRRLSEFAAGRLEESISDQVATHLEKCPDCQSTIVNLGGDQDTIGAVLRKVAGTSSQQVDPAVQKALTTAARMIPGSPSGKVAALTAAAGGPAVSLSFDQFATSLSETGVVDSDELTAAQQRLTAEQRADAQALARELITAGQLTKFQALNALQGKAKGLVFGEYLVIDRIGAGGMGQVFKARHRRMDRIVALKVMSSAAMKNADSVKRFQREVKAAAKLTHPNIVHAYDAGEQEGVHFLVMEFVDGPDLSSLVKKHGKLSPKQAADFVAQAARGLAYAHAQGVVHRDIKPGNLLLDHGVTVKILDLGLARVDGPGASTTKAEAELTQSGAVMGTVDYMAPEQALNTRHADAKSDVYSLGCALYRMLTGEALYAGESMVEKILAHRDRPIPPLRAVRPDVPPALDAIYQRMVAKKPSDRPSMQEISDALGSLETVGPGLSGIGLSGPGHSGIGLSGPGLSGIGLAATPTPIPQAYSVAGPTPVAAPAPMAARRENPGQRPPQAPPKKTSGAAPPKKGSNTTLLAAAGAGAVLIALGVWFIFRDDKGNETARVQLPDGGTVQTVVDPGPQKLIPPPVATPSATGSTDTSNVDPNKMFALPQSTGTAAPPPVSPPTTVAIASLAPTNPSTTPTVNVTPAQPGNLWIYTETKDIDSPITVDSLTYDGVSPLTIEGWYMPFAPPNFDQLANMSGFLQINMFNFGTRGSPGAVMNLRRVPTGSERCEVQVFTVKPDTGGLMRRNLWIRDWRHGVMGHLAVTISPINADLQSVKCYINGKFALEERVKLVSDPQGVFGTDGYWDELRVSKVVRYNGDFTPQRRYEPDADTLALYHCDEASGTQLVDASGNNHHGKLTNAKWVPVGSLSSPLAGTGPAVRNTTPAGSVDLLSLVDLDKHIVHGTWTRVDGKVVGGGTVNSRFQVPYTPPGEYDVTLAGRQLTDADSGILIGLVAKGRQFFVQVGSDFVSPSINGFIKNQYRVSGLALPLNRPFQITCAVRNDSVTVNLDGRRLLEFRDDFNLLGIAPHTAMPEKNQLFVGGWEEVNGKGSTSPEANWEITSLTLTPFTGTTTVSPAPVASVAPAVDPAVVCTTLAAKRKPLGLIAAATPFLAQDGDGRRDANGFFLPVPDRWRGQGTVWDLSYQWGNTAHTLILIHPVGDGHLRVHLQKDRVDVFPGGAWTTDYKGKSTFPIAIDPAAAQIFPLPQTTPLQIVSRCGGAGAYSLSINGKQVVSARIPAPSPQQLKPPITDAACPAVLGVGQGALIIGPMDGGVHEATNVRFTLGDGTALAATVTPAAPALTPSVPVASAPPAERRPVPETKERAEQLAIIKDIFKDDYAAALKAPEQKSTLAQKLLRQADASGANSAEAYALLSEAQSLAADAGDVLALRSVLDELTRTFQVDVAETHVAAWDELLRKPRPNPVMKTLHDEAVSLFRAGVSDGRLDDAKLYADFALNTTRRLRDAALTKDANDRNVALSARRTEWDAVKAAAEKLVDAPDDAAAQLTVGRYRAFVEQDWRGALPMLAQGSDEVLKKLAAQSLEPTSDAAKLAALGDAWWDAALSAPATKKADFYAGARFWYAQAAPISTGLQKTRIEKRSADAAALIPEPKIPPTRLAVLPQYAASAATPATQPNNGMPVPFFPAPAPGSQPPPTTNSPPGVPAPPPVGAAPPRPLPAGFRLPPNALPGLVGRMTVTQNGQGIDAGVLFSYQPGTVFLHDTVAPLLGPNAQAIISAKGITIQMAGVLYVPNDMEVAVWHAGGSSTGGNVFLYLDGREVSNVGDDKGKNNPYRFSLTKGEHAIGWKFRGGQLGNSLVDFYDGKTGEPLAVYATAEILGATRNLPTRQQIDNSANERRPTRPTALPPVYTGPAAAPALPPTNPPPTPPQTPATNPPPNGAAGNADPERRAAEWIIQVGGSGTARGPDGKTIVFSNMAPLPEVPFSIRSAQFLVNQAITDADLVNLAGLQNLNQILIIKTSMVGHGLKHLAASAKSLEYLSIKTPTITDDIFAHISIFANLKSLSLTECNITGQQLNQLASLQSLTHLFLDRSKITDAGLAQVASFPSVEAITLSQTQITDVGLQHLAKLGDRLKRVNLQNTLATSAGVEQLRKALPNCKIEY